MVVTPTGMLNSSLLSLTVFLLHPFLYQYWQITYINIITHDSTETFSSSLKVCYIISKCWEGVRE